MFKKIIFLVLFSWGTLVYALEEKLTVTTYYPSPYGSFQQLHVQGATELVNAGGSLEIGPSGGSASVTINGPLQVNGDVTVTGTVTADCPCPECDSCCGTSDIRFKKDITPLTGVLNKLKNINGVTYYWRTDEFAQMNFPNTRQIGMIAQDVEKEFPELVKTDAQGYKMLDYSRFTAVLLEAVKEQQKEINDLKSKVKEIKSKKKKG